MKFVIDKGIPFIHGVFEPFADTVYADGHEICRKMILDADALVVRTRTKCNSSLLEGSSVKLIATATIGTDHIDMEYCRNAGITVFNSAGCNAGGVVDYVFSALFGAASRKSIPLTGATIGIVGVGSVGSRVEQAARSLGFQVLLCDPPREAQEGSTQFVSLDTLLANSDVVTLHVPLTPETKGMADAEFFRKMRLGAFFINASRGEVVVDEDLIEAVPKLGPVILDTWNGEPHINLKLMELVDIATPHIAGYSYQGKQKGTMMAVRAVARYFSIPELYEFYPASDVEGLEAVSLNVNGMSQGQLASTIQYNYPIFTDDFLFRVNPSGFEELRDNYSYRREFYFDTSL